MDGRIVQMRRDEERTQFPRVLCEQNSLCVRSPDSDKLCNHAVPRGNARKHIERCTQGQGPHSHLLYTLSDWRVQLFSRFLAHYRPALPWVSHASQLDRLSLPSRVLQG
jgi:hypothetical protein